MPVQFDNTVNAYLCDFTAFASPLPITVCCYVYPTLAGTTQYCITKIDDFVGMFGLGQTSTITTDKFFFMIKDTGGTWRSVIGTTDFHLAFNQWYHITGVADGVNNHLYVNGIEDNTQVGCTSIYTSGFRILTVGGKYQGWASSPQILSGQIMDARYYNVALTQPEIQSIALGWGSDTIVRGLYRRWLLTGKEDGTLWPEKSSPDPHGDLDLAYQSGGNYLYRGDLRCYNANPLSPHPNLIWRDGPLCIRRKVR